MISTLTGLAVPIAIAVAVPAWVLISGRRERRRPPVPASLVQRAIAAPVTPAAETEIGQALAAVRAEHGIEECCEVAIGPDGGLWWRPCGRHAVPEATWRAWEDELGRTP